MQCCTNISPILAYKPILLIPLFQLVVSPLGMIKYWLECCYIFRRHLILRGNSRLLRPAERATLNIYFYICNGHPPITSFPQQTYHGKPAWVWRNLVDCLSHGPDIPTTLCSYCDRARHENLVYELHVNKHSFTHASWEARTGLGSRFPASKYRINSVLSCIPLYGDCPRENISQAVTPKAHTSEPSENSQVFRSSMAAHFQGNLR